MSSSDRSRGSVPGAGSEPAPPAPPAPGGMPSDAYSTWLDRMQRARARHAAITRNLYTWSNYKSWADRMKDSWEDGTEGAPPASPPGPAKTPRR